MTERPILFSDAMVRAILAGAKTMTRRVVAGARGAFWDHRNYTGTVERDGVLRFREGSAGTIVRGAPEVRCPYGAVGDRLWVREAWTITRDALAVYYRADYPSGNRMAKPAESDYESVSAWADRYHASKWHPSIHMPRWASRLTLEVTSVRVERVQSISEDDARAEGALSAKDQWSNIETARDSFAHLWDSLNGERPGCSWRDDPWVWVVSFRRVSL